MQWRSAGWADWCGAKPNSARTRRMAARAGWSKAARRRWPSGAMRGGRGPDAASPSECRDAENPRPLRRFRDWSGIWRAALYRSRTDWKISGMRPDEPPRAAGEQLALLCACGKRPIAVKRLGCCRSCYDRRHHSLRFFGGLREHVLERDRFRCRGCGVSSALVVHHRAPDNQAASLITLCIRCHLRVHRSSGSRYWFPHVLLRLWRELHRREPVQLQLALESRQEESNAGRLHQWQKGARSEFSASRRMKSAMERFSPRYSQGLPASCRSGG